MRIPASKAHFDEPKSVLNQPASEQAALAEWVFAVFFGNWCGFFRDVERLQILAPHQSDGVGKHVRVRARLAVLELAVEFFVERLRETQSRLKLRWRDVLWRPAVWQALLGIIDRHRRILQLQE